MKREKASPPDSSRIKPMNGDGPIISFCFGSRVNRNIPLSQSLGHICDMVDAQTKKTLGSIPLLKVKAGPRDKEEWPSRLKEELESLITVSWNL